jgi:ATP-dependent Clp protease ATP-binding subunit ClpX
MLNQKKSTASELVEIDTSKILFVGGGAFVDIEKIIRKRQTVSSIGFNSSTASTVDLSSIQVDDLIAYGLIPEFVGRFANVVTLRELTADELESILCHVENNIIAQYNYLCSCDDIELEFSSEAITRIIERCIQARTGARFLVAELEKVMRPHLFNLHRYSESGIHKIIIDQLLVDSPRSLLGEPER